MHISLKHLRCNWLRTELDNMIYSHVVLTGESSVQTVKILVILYVYFSWSVFLVFLLFRSFSKDVTLHSMTSRTTAEMLNQY